MNKQQVIRLEIQKPRDLERFQSLMADSKSTERVFQFSYNNLIDHLGVNRPTDNDPNFALWRKRAAEEVGERGNLAREFIAQALMNCAVERAHIIFAFCNLSQETADLFILSASTNPKIEGFS
jgi:hypothetical protein